MAEREKRKLSEVDWVKDTMTKFESLHPGLIDKLSIMATQRQISLSMYPQPTQGGASSTTGEQP